MQQKNLHAIYICKKLKITCILSLYNLYRAKAHEKQLVNQAKLSFPAQPKYILTILSGQFCV